MGTEVYELADAMLAELVGSGSSEQARVLQRYRADHPWNSNSVSVVLQLIEDLHSSGRLSESQLETLRNEVTTWPDDAASDSTDELPVLAGLEGDDATEELGDEDPNATAILPRGFLSLGADADADADAAVVIEPVAAEPVAAQPRRAPLLQHGTLLAGRYRLDQPVGSGGYCIVFLAYDERHQAFETSNQPIVVKALRSDLADDDRAIARLKHEFRTVRRLSHPGIVRVLDLDCDAGQWFFTMEFLEGESLAQRLRDPRRCDVALEQALRILEGCAAALDYAHARGEVHGDVKPANIFLTRTQEARLIDWSGRGPQVDDEDGDSLRSRAATRAYASPEVLDGAWPERTDDVFSLACVAYQLISGRHPFEGAASVEWRDTDRRPTRVDVLPDGAARALEHALSWHRQDRPASAGEFIAALTAPEEPAAVIAPPPAATVEMGDPIAADDPAPAIPPPATERPADRPPPAMAKAEPQPDAIATPDQRVSDAVPTEAVKPESKPVSATLASAAAAVPLADTVDLKPDRSPPRAARSETAIRPAPTPRVEPAARAAATGDSAEPWWSRKPVIFATAVCLALIVLVIALSSHELVDAPAGPADETAADDGQESPGRQAPLARSDGGPNPAVAVPLAEETLTDFEVVPLADERTAGTAAAAESASPAATIVPAETLPPTPAQVTTPAPAAQGPAPGATWVSFEAPEVVTSEAAVAAVLRLQRLERFSGRVRVSWRAVGESATAGEDFDASATGTAEFADGQKLRAIYVPLLPDQIAEGTETFFVELTTDRKNVRIGPIGRVQVTIRDDD
jgi:serine/threonine protein kinase